MEKNNLKKSNSCFLSLNKDYSNYITKRRLVLLSKKILKKNLRKNKLVLFNQKIFL